MFSTKSFIRKNKVGNYVKNTREHYIRNDIYCGIPTCDECLTIETTLSSTFVNKNKKFKHNHYIILDTNVVLDQIDILEEDAVGNVIIMHTVLKEVKHRNLPTYKRLVSIIDNPTRHFYIFTNDHHMDTYLQQEKGESVNDYNDRCIRKASSWYMKHMPSEIFILITDDSENRKKAISHGIQSCTITEYVKAMKNATLEDKLSRKDFHAKIDADDFFPPHLSPEQVVVGMKEGRLLQGTFKCSHDNFLEGFVNVDDSDEPIIVQGRSGLNRAVDGDTVAVELLKKDEWVAPSDIILEDESNVEGVEEVILKEKELMALGMRRKQKENVKPTGKIVGIVRRKWRQYCGILQTSSLDGIFHLFVPSDRKIPKIRIETRQAEFLKTQKLIVAIDSWPLHSRYPNGHFVRALGKIGDQSTENEVILLEHDVPHSKFSEEVLSCLPKLPWTVTEDDLKARVDLRDYDICSVDPPGCTDIDDALHCRTLEKGNFEVGVHIADVSHFIRPATALDVEAASRATTVYLVDNRIDMVPALLSSNLCSLIADEDRFAFSCIWEMDRNAKITSTRFHKSVIKSKRSMTYEEAQIVIDDTKQTHSIAQSLRSLNKLAKILKARRLANGALVLASPEVKIQMDSETHDPIDVEVKKLFETNAMVEEFMLLANIRVAHKILQDFPECAMLRRHPSPPASNFDPLIKAGNHLGLEININSGKALATSLDLAVSQKNPYQNTMLRILATRCMLQAVYFPSGMLQQSEFCHYGLAVPLYTHFTSPIRRYADIIVHRLLAVSIGADAAYPQLLEKHSSNELCKNLNYRNRMAQYAGRASVQFNTHLFFKGKLQDEDGYILYVRKNALQILLPKYGLECTLFIAEKGCNSAIFTYNEDEQTQTSGNVVFHAFDPVTVRLSLDSKNIQHEKFVLQLVKPYVEGFSVPALSSTVGSKIMDVDEEVSPRKKSKRK